MQLFRRNSWHATSVLAKRLCGVAPLFILGAQLFIVSPAVFASNTSLDVVSKCADRLLDQVRHDTVTIATVEDANRVCQARLYAEAALRDFEIRRQKFSAQAHQETVLLWMVVAITVAGVGLAGLQLVLAFRLASTGPGALADSNELAVERGKLSVKSSVTGLLVLICSFAFFWVFVHRIYVVEEVNASTLANRTSTSGSNRQLQAGPPKKTTSPELTNTPCKAESAPSAAP